MLVSAAIAIGVWWNANTVSHLFIHRPFFKSRWANAAFAVFQSAAMGFPQSVWRDRHIAHHAGRAYRFRLSRETQLQVATILGLWIAIVVVAPTFFITGYLPGYVGALLLCAVHGHYEHAGGTTSHYGRLYNLLTFNDGYHVEHHLHPSTPWHVLRSRREPAARASAWPAPLRWLECVSLDALERLTLRSPLLQRVVVRMHERAFRPLVAALPGAREIAIVGGGLFPRTALVVRRLLPDAHVTIIDASRANLERARAFMRDDTVTYVHRRWDAAATAAAGAPWDLMVFPLAFDGDRDAIYTQPPAATVLVHDWIWRRRGASRIVSAALLKRVNLMRR